MAKKGMKRPEVKQPKSAKNSENVINAKDNGAEPVTEIHGKEKTNNEPEYTNKK